MSNWKDKRYIEWEATNPLFFCENYLSVRSQIVLGLSTCVYVIDINLFIPRSQMLLVIRRSACLMSGANSKC